MMLIVLLSSRILAARVYRDPGGEVAFGHRCRYFCDVAYLICKVAGHAVDRIRQIFHNARDARHLGLTTQLALGSYFMGNARHFRRKRIELIHHHVDRVLKLENFAANIDRDLAR